LCQWISSNSRRLEKYRIVSNSGGINRYPSIQPMVITLIFYNILRQKELQASALDTAIEQALAEMGRELGISESERP
jgi:hypothetical protein